MITLPNYQLTAKIHESDNSLVYRGVRTKDNCAVILKVLRKDYPTPAELTRYRQEYDLTSQLELEGIVKAYSWEKYQNTPIIIFEDFGGVSLKILMGEKKFTILEFLEIAIKIVQSIGAIHAHQIIHKDINPSNIVFNPKTKQLKIIDFGISTILKKEETLLKNPRILEGTLAYMSPEQTGRMNRYIDYRTDFYSLGATFYEILTYQLPFLSDDALELVYFHLAKRPIAPHKLYLEIPQVLSNIILKLLAKNAEDRYQSTSGILEDLKQCLHQLENCGEIKRFLLGSADISQKFQLPQKLYGREAEIETLLTAFRRVADGNAELMLVSGYSGIGKTALVQVLYQPITALHGYFIAGKFEQYQRNIPYFAIIQSIRKLIEQLLNESENNLIRWRDKIQQALGNIGQVMIELFPELEMIVGKQPAVPTLPPTESENRLRLVFQNFILVFTQAQHPLVIFLDDLQWADAASLKLMQLLLSSHDSKYILLIGAYRDNEVHPGHIWMLAIEEIRKSGVNVNQLSLSALSLNNVNNLIVDTLNISDEATLYLAKLVLTKTQGNAFFVREFIQSLYAENLIYFNHQHKKWQWDTEQIKARDITDNVVELMAVKIQKLLEPTQELLKLAACMGNEFSLYTLALVAEKSFKDTALLLREALIEGLILSLNNDYKSIELDVVLPRDITIQYKFVHDRIQQAAYSLISDSQKKSLHLRIGELLLQNISPDEQESKIFDIVNQFNFSIDLINRQEQRHELAHLNLIAGKKAKTSAAYQAALAYLRQGVELLPVDKWEIHYEVTLALHLEAAEAAYLCGKFDEMELLISEVIQQAKILLDQVKAYEIKIAAYIAQSKSLEAISLGVTVLKMLGVKLTKNPSQLNVFLVLLKIKFIIGKRYLKKLKLEKIIDKQEKFVVLRLLTIIASPAYRAFPKLFVLITLQLVRLSVKYGNSIWTAIAYSAYGIILCGIVGDIEAGYQTGQLSLNLISRFEKNEVSAIVKIIYVFNTLIRHWKEHLDNSLEPLLQNYYVGLEAGSLEFSSITALAYYSHSYFLGKNLKTLKEEINKSSDLINRINQKDAFNYLSHYYQSILILNKSNLDLDYLKDLEYEKKIINFYKQTNNKYGLADLYINKLIIHYFFENFVLAIDIAKKAEDNLDGVIAHFILTIFYFYDSLAKLAVYSSKKKLSIKNILIKVRSNQNKIKKWSNHAPMNFLHKFYLVEAELNRVLGKHTLAMDLYDKAIALAKKHEYLNEEALANELAAKFYLAKGNEQIAAVYLKEARYCYVQWGAHAKVKHLDNKYPHLLSNLLQTDITVTPNKTTTASGGTDQEWLDLTTFIKASKALSQEKDLNKLLENLVKFLLENSGAQQGILILEKSGNLFIKVEGSTEKNLKILPSVPLEQRPDLPLGMIKYVQRTKEAVILNQGQKDRSSSLNVKTKYIHNKSVLCSPILSQGRVIGILYLENNLTSEIFNDDRLEVIKLISTQAAIAIENALLRQQESQLVYEYQVGGSLTSDSPTYVVRSADQELYHGLKLGEFCYVLTSRQMGKTSLRVQMMKKLIAEGFACVAIDLTTIGSQNINIEQWYAGLIYTIVKKFKLSGNFDFKAWWRTLDFLSPVQRFSEFIQEVVLQEISTPIVIFIDEIDSILSLNVPMDDFFAAIRSCYNHRGEHTEFQRLTFVILGVASPAQLIQNKTRTPFNIGRAISLSSFQLHEVQPLTKGLAVMSDKPEAVIQEVLNWTGGQPFLTQKLCSLILASGIFIHTGNEAEQVEQVVRSKIVEDWETKDEPEHLKTIRVRLLMSSNASCQLLKIYQQILQEGEVTSDGSPEQAELLLSGIVKKEAGKLRVYNRIYQTIFDEFWLAHLLNL